VFAGHLLYDAGSQGELSSNRPDEMGDDFLFAQTPYASKRFFFRRLSVLLLPRPTVALICDLSELRINARTALTNSARISPNS
jgi:hypothetical protein